MPKNILLKLRELIVKISVIIFIFLLLGLTSVSADATAVQQWQARLAKISSQLSQKKTTVALNGLKELVDDLKSYQQKTIQSYFPSKFQNFSMEHIEDVGYELEGAVINPGNVFTARYTSRKEDATIDVSVAFQDSTVSDYAMIVKNPDLITERENTKVIRVNDIYFALENNNPEENFCERNILLNSDLVVSIIISGPDSYAKMEAFTGLVQFSRLEAFFWP